MVFILATDGETPDVLREFIMSKDNEITPDVVMKFIKKHQAKIPWYEISRKMYEGKHAILEREAREKFKPDNRLVVNMPKYIVDTFNGYFIGIPVKESHDDEGVHNFLKEFARNNDLDNHEAELAKMTSIYGNAFEYMYQDENANSMVVYNSPLDMFMVYDDTIHQGKLFAVRYTRDDKKRLFGEVITKTERIEFKETDKGQLSFDNRELHHYIDVPVNEYIENEERFPVFESVKTLCNALNNALSAKADDVDYFADAYLVIKGASLDEDTMEQLRNNRTINIAGEGTEDIVIEFLEKPSADGTQENLIERLLDLIYQISMVANINDDKFGNSSGVAMEYKLQPMSNLAIMKERKFKSSFQERYRLLFSIPTNLPSVYKDEWRNIEYQFKRNLPRNTIEEVQTARDLEGIVSKETQLSRLSFVDDAKDEIKRMEAEEPQEDDYDISLGEVANER